MRCFPRNANALACLLDVNSREWRNGTGGTPCIKQGPLANPAVVVSTQNSVCYVFALLLSTLESASPA